MKKILCFGDSNTYGYDPRTGKRYPKGVRWTSILADRLGDSFEVVEEGCNGRTTVFEEPGAPWKAGRASIQVILNSHKPVDLVILMLGSNDLKTIFHAEAATIAAGAEVLVQMIQAFTTEKQEKPAKVLLVSPPVIGDGITSTSPFGVQNNGNFDASSITRSKQFRSYYKNIAERYGCLFVDAAEHIKSSDVDSLHLDPEAHKILGEIFSKVILSAYPEENTYLEEGSYLKDTYLEEDSYLEQDNFSEKNTYPEENSSPDLNITHLRRIIARLRDPETGCRWDRAQTLDSLKPCCVEETAEVLAGIAMYNATGHAENLKEELGDLLLQIVLQSRIAEEKGLFTLDDVIQVISEKMLRRHPHVFHLNDPANGDLEELIRLNQAKDADGNLLTTWADIKALEKKGKESSDAYLKEAFEEVRELVRAAEERKFGK